MEMLRKLEQSQEDQRVLFKHCAAHAIDFLSSPFDLESIDFLAGLGMASIKIPSCEITNVPFLRRVGAIDTRVILSTGMSFLGEVEQAVETLVLAGTDRTRITLLHCNTQYPTPMADVNLLAMLTMGAALGLEAGFSDHTPGIEIPIAAAALGAVVIEKHFTLDRTLEGPDHKASLEPGELKAMVDAIRNVEAALGSGVKRPSASEGENRTVMRKSIVAGRFIPAGELLTPSNLAVKRPATGISPLSWDRVVNTLARRDFQKDEPID
jgi:N,N'-diacetyllegionaminate synthase